MIVWIVAAIAEKHTYLPCLANAGTATLPRLDAGERVLRLGQGTGIAISYSRSRVSRLAIIALGVCAVSLTVWPCLSCRGVERFTLPSLAHSGRVVLRACSSQSGLSLTLSPSAAVPRLV